MKKLTIIGLVYILTRFLYAQQIPLAGYVFTYSTVDNTREYIKNASVEAKGSNPRRTDDIGHFHLEIVGIANGTLIPVIVKKSGLVVVNDAELSRVCLGRLAPLFVTMAREGELAELTGQYREICELAMRSEVNRFLARLRGSREESEQARAELERRFGRKFANREEAEKALFNQLEKMQGELTALAAGLARLAMTAVSQETRQVFELFEKGEVGRALELLNKAGLDAAYRDALKIRQEIDEDSDISMLARSELTIDRVAASYELKAGYLLILLRPAEAKAAALEVQNIRGELERFYREDVELRVQFELTRDREASLGRGLLEELIPELKPQREIPDLRYDPGPPVPDGPDFDLLVPGGGYSPGADSFQPGPAPGEFGGGYSPGF